MSLETKAAAIGVAGVAGYGLAAELVGVPVSVVLAAFLGAAGILSFLPAMPVKRMIGTVIFCTSTAIYAGPVVVRKLDWLAGAETFAALALAALLQLALPWLIENRGRIFERWLPAKKEKDGGNDR